MTVGQEDPHFRQRTSRTQVTERKSEDDVQTVCKQVVRRYIKALCIITIRGGDSKEKRRSTRKPLIAGKRPSGSSGNTKES